MKVVRDGSKLSGEKVRDVAAHQSCMHANHIKRTFGCRYPTAGRGSTEKYKPMDWERETTPQTSDAKEEDCSASGGKNPLPQIGDQVIGRRYLHTEKDTTDGGSKVGGHSHRTRSSKHLQVEELILSKRGAKRLLEVLNRPPLPSLPPKKTHT